MMKRSFVPILISDFCFWASTAGLAPLTSRLVDAQLSGERTNAVISWMLLAFTIGAFIARFVAGRFAGEPKKLAIIAGIIAVFSILPLYSSHVSLWLLGQVLSGWSLGFYGIAIMRLTSSMLTRSQRMRGFALIGMADFLGFSFGPVLSGISVKAWGFGPTFTIFCGLLLVSIAATLYMPLEQKENEDNSVYETAPSGLPLSNRMLFLRFLPLFLATFFSLFYHAFYSRYLPVMFDTGAIAIESLFFGGYVLGGIGFRLGIVGWLEKQSGTRAFFYSIIFVCISALMVAVFPQFQQGLNPFVVLTGVMYGLGFEAIYIFSLAWIANHTSKLNRGTAYAFVLAGFDVANVFAGFGFGPMANAFSPMGLMYALLLLIPPFLMLPLLLRRSGLGASPLKSSK